ncbi:MAG: prolyl oligopeptidase family serine peptidase [Erysipelotrichaceae bacterium]|nr:prolyl oligopeptidase family serine peptidase [Erysipelotrichaceae bacterium]MDY6034661.1 prolyl oligopeptidase family serine peptidase [Bulleidia sp.]
MNKITYKDRQYQIYGNGSAKTAILYLTEEEHPENTENIYQGIENQDVLFIAVYIKDWGRELSPWIAPAIFGKQDFGDGASLLLAELKDFWQWFIQEHDIHVKHLCLSGYSLAGMFALWTMSQTEMFDQIAAVSPSVWFLNMTQHIKTHTVYAKDIYMSLGDKEANTKNPTMASVKANFEEIVAHLKQRNINITSELNPGNHFRDAEKRVIKALNRLVGEN